MSSNVSIRYRPLDRWNEPPTEPQASPFRSTWSDTQSILRREVWAIADPRNNYPDVTIELDVPASAIRVDGGLKDRSTVRSNRVVVSFDSEHGPLRYACDTFISLYYRQTLTDWQHNVRAVALGLEALRKVTRYGIGLRGEQYTGWAAIGTGMPMGASRAGWSIENAMAMLGLRGTIDAATVSRARAELARIHHPDRGGSTEQMQQINAAADWLLSNAV